MYGRRILLDGSLSLRELRGAFLNYPIQSSASDLLKLTMRRLWQEGASILASVHDEILLAVKPSRLKQSKALFEEAAAEAGRSGAWSRCSRASRDGRRQELVGSLPGRQEKQEMKPSHLLMRRVSGLRPGVDRAPATLLRTKLPPRLESSIKVPAPEGLSYLPFQRAGIEFLSQCEAALLADEMGLGKTVEIAGLLNYRPEIVRVLVVCPASLKINWQRELTRWLVDSSRSIAIWNGGRKPGPSADVVILNYELLGKFETELKRAPWDLIVFDEAHFLKTPEAQRTRAAKRLVPYARRRVCLTGTPMLGRPCELWSLLNLLESRRMAEFLRFRSPLLRCGQNFLGMGFQRSEQHFRIAPKAASQWPLAAPAQARRANAAAADPAPDDRPGNRPAPSSWPS